MPFTHMARAPRATPHSVTGPWAAAGAFTACVVIIRFWIARQISYCGTPDSCSYLALGESLSHHRGFVENFLYQYQMIDPKLPQHGVEYWRPGTSFFLLLAQPFGGVTLHSSLLITILAGIVLAAAAWRTVRTCCQDPWLATLAYALCLVLPPVWTNSITPDSSLFYGAAVAWFLLLFRCEFRSVADDALAWIALATVNLIRNDGILLLPSVLVVLWIRRHRSSDRGASLAYSGIVLLGFFAAMLPMHWISRAVLGHASSSTVLQSLYLQRLPDLIAYHQPLTLHGALAYGAKALVKMRLAATATILYRWAFLMAGFGIILITGLLPSMRRAGEWMMPEWQGGVVFFLALLAAYGLVLPAIGTFSSLRSSNGLLALLAAAMVAGALRLTWSRSAALALGWSAVGVYLVLGAMDAHRSIAPMNQQGDQLRDIGRYLSAHSVDPRRRGLVMTADAAQFSETTSYPAIPIPSNGVPRVLEAVRDLHPAYVLIDNPATGFSGDNAVLISALHPVSAERVPGTDVLVLTLAGYPHSGPPR